MDEPASRGQLYFQARHDIIAADNRENDDQVRIMHSLNAIAKLMLAADTFYWMEHAPPRSPRQPNNIQLGGL
jgi:hypothetical protein